MEPTKIEYRVRPVTRYIVTRYEETSDRRPSEGCGSICEKGTYDNAHIAHEVAYALCRAEHEQLGWPGGDDRITYPVEIYGKPCPGEPPGLI